MWYIECEELKLKMSGNVQHSIHNIHTVFDFLFYKYYPFVD